MQQRKKILAMVHPWKKILLSLSAAAFLFTACKKNMSNDNPLPTSYYPSIIMGSDNFVLYALNPGTGAKNWEYSMPTDTFNVPVGWRYFKPSPLIYNNMVYQVSVSSDTIYKLNAKTGALVKKMVLPGHTSVPYPGKFFTCMATPMADAGIIYLATTNDTIYAIDTGTATIKWKYGAESSLLASPVIYNGKVYIATSAGHVICLDKNIGPDATGYPVWDWPGKGAVTPTVSFISSPAISDPYLYVGGAKDSNMYCIYLKGTNHVTPDTGILRWTYKTLGNINSSPTAYAGMCIFGCNDFYVYCVDSQTAGTNWKFWAGSQVNSSPIISNQVVYIGSYDYNLYALNIINGLQKWRFSTKGLIKSSPLPYNGNVYVGSYDGYLYAVDSAFGVLKWSFKINGNIECSPAIDDYTGMQYNSGISGFNTSGNNN